MNIEIDRRTMLSLSALGIATVGLAGCGGASGSGGSMRASWFGGEPVHAAMQEAISIFEQRRDDVSFDVDYAAFDDFFDRLATETAGGSAPDVLRMSMSFFADYAGRGALLPLDDYVGSTISLDHVDPDVADSGLLNDQYFGVGQSSITHTVVINPELISSLGAELPDPDWTWDEMAEWSKDIGRSNEDVYGMADMGGNIQAFEVWVRQNGADLFTEDGMGLAFDQAVLEEWWAYWQSMREESGTPPASVTAEGSGFDGNPVTRGIAMGTWAWVQQIVFLQELNTHSLEILPFPSLPGGENGHFVKALDFWCISENSSDPDIAADLVNFLISDEEAVQTIGLTLGVPPSETARSFLDTDPNSAEGKAIAYIDSIDHDSMRPAPGPWPQGYGDLQSEFSRIHEDLAFGNSDLSEATTDLFSTAERALSGF